MNLTLILCIVFSLGFLAAGVAFFILSHLYSRPRPAEERSDRAVADQGDRVLWEMSQGWSFVDSNPQKIPLSRRRLLTRVALGLSAMVISSRMARGLSAGPSLRKLVDADSSSESALPRGAALAEGEGQQDHTDTHNDFDVHSDNMMSHQDTTYAKGHYDVPHSDFISGHWDTHNDN